VSPQREEYWGNVNPIGIRSCYDEGKRAAETLCFDYKRQYGLDSRVVRIFNTYGPNMSKSDGRVVSNFIVQAIRNEPLVIYGDGTQTRSFCYVSDLIEGIYKLFTLDSSISSPINLGNPNEFTIMKLAQTIISITGSSSHIVHSSLPQDDPQQRKPDISNASQTLNWNPTVDLDEGLTHTISYFRKVLANERVPKF
jgi:UDP-glucuronate decarboxylase